MVGGHREETESKGGFYEDLEAITPQHIQRMLQDLLEQEEAGSLGRSTSGEGIL